MKEFCKWQTPIEEKQNMLNYCLNYIIATSKSAAWMADAYIHSQKHFFNYLEQIEFTYIDHENQDSVNSPKNLALKNARGTFIEPSAVFDQNYCGRT